jgi:predicted SAM-dependent methyltransferase
MHLVRINIGCGSSPTPGFLNFDNSLSVRLASLPLARDVLTRLPVLHPARRKFIAIAREKGVQWANATKGLSLESQSAEVVYTSHMLEHLSYEDARRFLRECHRLLAPGGILRVVVPDLRRITERYLKTGDADAFIRETGLGQQASPPLVQRLTALVSGFRDHSWMYDSRNLGALLRAEGFTDVTVLQPGETRIPNPGALNLSERAEESLFVEAFR